ncbi:DUF2938 domain-containing protein [Kiloniella antarctica]|uniref:DUF2938 domain-containing protein n=1 Tax=Kiloniella antarctica TaxID=1550907 RepID=A0ABW5BM10_9PROT
MEENVFWFVVIGLGATLIMDVWALILRLIWKVPSMNYGLVGRWVGHLRFGVVSHEQIGASPMIPYEKLRGWVVHYFTGAVFSVLFGFIVGTNWLADPQIIPAVVFGVITLIFPFFILQPAFGAGLAASKTPNPTIARLKSLNAHMSFGLGLYLIALVLSFL